jgi:hypothetical protein
MPGESPETGREKLSANECIDRVVSALVDNQIDQTLTPAAYKDFEQSMRTFRSVSADNAISGFILQFYLTENIEELTNPHTTNWVGVYYTFEPTDPTTVRIKGMYVLQPPNDIDDLHTIPSYENMATHTIELTAINWDYLGVASSNGIPDTL